MNQSRNSSGPESRNASGGFCPDRVDPSEAAFSADRGCVGDQPQQLPLTKPSQITSCKAIAKDLKRPVKDRMITISRTRSIGASFVPLLCFLCFLLLNPSPSHSATVWGTLLDLHLTALDTPLTWYPTNAVLVTSGGGGGLSVGPAFTSYPTNGVFTNVVDAGPYTICLQLNNWRNCFTLTVPGGTNTYNITNILSNKLLADGLGGAILADP